MEVYLSIKSDPTMRQGTPSGNAENHVPLAVIEGGVPVSVGMEGEPAEKRSSLRKRRGNRWGLGIKVWIRLGTAEEL